MSSVQHLRAVICERLTAAAMQIFSEVERTIMKYEEERQSRQLDHSWNPQLKLHRVDVQRELVQSTELILLDQQLGNPGSNFSQNQEEPELKQIKEEQEGLCTNQEEETPPMTVQPKESESSEAEPDRDQSTSQRPSDSQEQQSSTEPSPNNKHPCSHGNNGHQSETSESSRVTGRDKTSGTADVCEKVFKTKNQIKLHREIQTSQRKLICSICGETFLSSSNLTAHVRSHTGDGLFSCRICKETFSQNSQLIKHQTVHTVRSPDSGKLLHFCPTCDKKFSFRSSLVTHMKIHSGEKLHSCRTCGKKFANKSGLCRHRKFHRTAEQNSDKPEHSCSICQKKFPFHSKLIRHIRSHRGEKPHSGQTRRKNVSQPEKPPARTKNPGMNQESDKPERGCSSGGQKVSYRSTLFNHTRVRAGEKPHSCDTCGERFAFKSGLRRHTSFHSAGGADRWLYRCHVCGRPCVSHSSLVTHIKAHTGEKPQ